MTDSSRPVVRRCILCGAREVDCTSDDRLDRVTCLICGAEFEVEWNPPDAPGLRGRIEVIRPPSRNA